MCAANIMAIGMTKAEIAPSLPEKVAIEAETFAQSFDAGMKESGELPAQKGVGEVHPCMGPTASTATNKKLAASSVLQAEGGKRVDAQPLLVKAKIAPIQAGSSAVSAAASPVDSLEETLDAGKTEAVAPPNTIVSSLEPSATDHNNSSIATDKLNGETLPEKASGRDEVPIVTGQAPIEPSREDGLKQGAKPAVGTHAVALAKKTQLHPGSDVEAQKSAGSVWHTGSSVGDASIPIGQSGATAANTPAADWQSGGEKTMKSGPVAGASEAVHADAGTSATPPQSATAALNTGSTKSVATAEPAMASAVDSAASSHSTPAAETAVLPAAKSIGDTESKTQNAHAALSAASDSLGIGVAATGIPVAHGTSASMASEVMGQKTHAAGDLGHGAALQAEAGERVSPGESGLSMEGSARMLTTTPAALEVGVQNGTHGWLKVRAEISDGGSVSASVSASTATGQEMLHRELPALNAYLQQEKVAVSAVTVHTVTPGGGDHRNSSADAGGGLAQQASGEGGQRRQSAREQAPAAGVSSYAALDTSSDDGMLPAATYLRDGGWLSVRA